MLMSRKLRYRLDSLHPDARQRVQNEQRKQKELQDQHAVDRRLLPGDPFERIRETTKVVSWSAPVSYTIQLEDDREIHRHQDQAIQRETPKANETEVRDPDLNQQPVPDPPVAGEEEAVPAAQYLQRNRQAPDYYL